MIKDERVRGIHLQCRNKLAETQMYDKSVAFKFATNLGENKMERRLCSASLFPVLSVRFQGAACPVSGAELESLLSCIRDLLPDLGEGFLLACLEEYDYNSELVINNILEDRLAPGLDKLDRAMPR